MTRCRCGTPVRSIPDGRRVATVDAEPRALALPLRFKVPAPWVDAFSLAGDRVRGRLPTGDEPTVNVNVEHLCPE